MICTVTDTGGGEEDSREESVLLDCIIGLYSASYSLAYAAPHIKGKNSPIVVQNRYSNIMKNPLKLLHPSSMSTA